MVRLGHIYQENNMTDNPPKSPFAQPNTAAVPVDPVALQEKYLELEHQLVTTGRLIASVSKPTPPTLTVKELDFFIEMWGEKHLNACILGGATTPELRNAIYTMTPLNLPHHIFINTITEKITP